MDNGSRSHVNPECMEPFRFYRFCPRCGAACDPVPDGARFECAACHFVLYFNPAIAVAAIVRNAQGRILFIRRGREPGKGKLAFPGGFVDIGETAERALLREFKEEVNLPLSRIQFLCSVPNRYFYREITYPTVDVFFTAVADAPGEAAAPGEVECVTWLLPAEVQGDTLAFPSMAEAWRQYLSSQARS